MNSFASTRTGRVVLHMIAMLGDHQWRWHLAGIRREVLP
jgi:hypothetical protein